MHRCIIRKTCTHKSHIFICTVFPVVIYRRIPVYRLLLLFYRSFLYVLISSAISSFAFSSTVLIYLSEYRDTISRFKRDSFLFTREFSSKNSSALEYFLSHQKEILICPETTHFPFQIYFESDILPKRYICLKPLFC
jgi:hypothetical protein